MPDSERADAADEIEEGVAVHVVDERPLGAFHHDLGRLAEAIRDRRGPPREGRAAAGAGNFRLQLDRSHYVCSFTDGPVVVGRTAPGTSFAASSTMSTL